LKPAVLVVTTSRWFPTARLAVALDHAGGRVQAVCPAGHPIEKTTAVKRTFRYRGLLPLRSIAAAIAATKAELLVPGDDLATAHLHALYEQSSRAGKSGAAVRGLIERSLGAPGNFLTIGDRASFMQVAEQAGVRIPQTMVVPGLAELERWSTQTGFPVVLKANGTSGGEGVRVVKNIDEARRAWSALGAPPLLARAVKHALLDRDTTLLGPSLGRRTSAVTAQSFVAGREATSAVACWQGKILASLHFEVLQKGHAAGHATVLRRVANPEMAAAAETMVQRLHLSGLHGFDFMLDNVARHAYLIEINPRATQAGHLSFGAGCDLPVALLSALTGRTPAPSLAVTENDVVALFPQEWLRDPASPYLRSGYHDVPWDQPELLRLCVRKPGGRRLRKWVQRFRG
jgi:hypothetical protein